MNEMSELYREARRAAAWGIAINVLLGLTMLAGGLLGHSYGLAADAFHSLMDAMVSTTLYVALILAERPADPEHPYGHTRIEAVAGASIAVFLIGLALVVGWNALQPSHDAATSPHAFTVFIAAASAIGQELLSRYAKRVATRTGSAALLAASWDYRLDALGSTMVLVGVAAAHWGGPEWRWTDHAAALIVVAAILWIGSELLWKNVQELMDRQADPAMLDTVRREALAVTGVQGVEKLRVRKSGLEHLVDIHVEVDPDISVREGHAIAHAVKDRVTHQIITVRDVLVHIEPAE